MIELDNISYRYPFQEKMAVENLSLSVGAGECVLLTGPSGCVWILALFFLLIVDFCGEFNALTKLF